MIRAAILALVVLAGCIRIGRHADSDPRSFRATGVRATVDVGSTRVDGELLEVQDGALVLLTPSQVVSIPSRAITRIFVEDGGKMRGFDPAERSELRLLSRYPPGMPAAALRQILTSRNQSDLVVITQ